MSFVLKVPCEVTYASNVVTTQNLEVVCSDRIMAHDIGYIIDEEYEATDGVSFNSCLNRALSYLPFNPLTTLTFHSNNYESLYNSFSSDMKRYLNNTSPKTISWSPIPNERETFYDYNIDGNVIQINAFSPLSCRIESTADYYAGAGLAQLQSCEITTRWTSLSYAGCTFRLQVMAAPERTYDHGEVINTQQSKAITIGITTGVNNTFGEYVSTFRVSISDSTGFMNPVISSLRNAYVAEGEELPGAYTYNPSNPFDTDEPSAPGGGDGDYSGAQDVDKVDFADIPPISAITTGLLTMYNPSLSQIQALGNFLWSSGFDINTFKKLFADPMDAIIGLGIVPVNPSLGGTKTVHFGDVDTEVSMPYCSSQFVQKDFGSVKVKKDIGAFTDFDYSTVQIYLPYIGIRSLSTEDVMGCTLSLRYNIDILTGGCSAQIYVSDKGLLYQYNGNCIANVPLTAINYSGAIQNAVSAAISVGTTAVGAVTGMAPLTLAGVSGMATSAANAVTGHKPTIERSGQMGGSAGLMSSQTPYLIIQRPRLSVPSKIASYTGNMLNVTMNLATCEGFTMIDYIHLDNVPCTDNERSELESILKQGVIF